MFTLYLLENTDLRLAVTARIICAYIILNRQMQNTNAEKKCIIISKTSLT